MNTKINWSTIALAIMLVTLGALVWSHHSLGRAVNELHACEQAGHAECHVEADGLEYNVYWKED